MLTLLRSLLQGAISFFQVKPKARTRGDERRRLIRLRCDYAVKCVVEDTQFPARILDMGINGMRLRLQERLKPGTNVFIYYAGQADPGRDEYVLCLVRWARRRRNSEEIEAGLQYVDTEGNMRRSWIQFLLKELGFNERAIYTRRKQIRAESTLSGELVTETEGSVIEGRILNLGVGGALFESSASFSAQTAIRIRCESWSGLKPLDLPALVLHVKRPDPAGPYLSSVRFLDLNARQLRVLGQYVLQLLKETTD